MQLAPQELSEDSSTADLVAWAIRRFQSQRILVTTGFGMEGCVLIDLIARQRVRVPILYLDTHFFFPETHELRRELQARYPHLPFINAGTSLTPAEQEAAYGPELWRFDPDRCCELRKVEPMRRAVRRADVWITALTRSQSPARAKLRTVEWDWRFDILKISPLASWSREQIWSYVREHDLPYNRLHDQGYPTIGCTHCTRPVPGLAPGEYSREGRWQGQGKTECGLHHILNQSRESDHGSVSEAGNRG